MEEDLSETEDGEIKRYDFRKRPSSQMENMKKSLSRRKKSKGNNNTALVAPSIFQEGSEDYTEDEFNCDIIIKDEPLFELDEEEGMHEEEEMDDSQNYFEEVSMEPPMLSDACDDITLDEESDPLCCGSAFPPSMYTNSPHDIQLEALDDSDMVFKDPLTLNTLKTSTYSQTFFIKKEVDPEKVVYVKKEKEDIDSDNTEQVLRSELPENSLDLQSNFDSDNVKVKLEFNNEQQNWDKITQFNCSSLFNVESTDGDDNIDPMEYVSCQSSIEHKNKPKSSNSSESKASNSYIIKSDDGLNEIQVAEVSHDNILEQSSCSDKEFNLELTVQDINSSKYSVKLLTGKNQPNPCADSQMISKIASQVPQNFINRLDDGIKIFKNSQKNKILIVNDKNTKSDDISMVASTSQIMMPKSPIEINKYRLKNTNQPNSQTTNSGASLVNTPYKLEWLKSLLGDKLRTSSTQVLDDKQSKPLTNAANIEKEENQSIFINESITTHDETKEMPKIWVNRDVTNSFNNPSQETENHLKEKEERTISEKTDKTFSHTLHQEIKDGASFGIFEDSSYVEKEEEKEQTMWGSFVNSKEELAASNWVPVKGMKDGIYTMYKKVLNEKPVTRYPKIAPKKYTSQVPIVKTTNTADLIVSEKNYIYPILNKNMDKKTITNINLLKPSEHIKNKSPDTAPPQTSKKSRKQKLVPKSEDIKTEENKVHNSRKQKIKVNDDVIDEIFYLSCTSCKKVFPDIDQYNMHTEVYYDNEKLRKCKLCKEICETFCDLYSHYLYHSTVDKVNYCSLTSFDFMNPKTQLLDYIKLYNHQEPGTFICFCGKIHDFRNGLVSHVDRYYLKCRDLSLRVIKKATSDDECLAIKQKRKNTRKALRTDRMDYDFYKPKLNVAPKCRVCKLEFDNRRVYLEHIRFEHKQTYFCEHCPFEFTCKSKIMLQRHMINLHLKSRITSCSAKFK